MSKLRRGCEQELDRMKATFIQGFSFSLFDFFTESNEYNCVSLLSNSAVVEAFKRTNFEKKYPLYADLIMRHFEKSLERKGFLDKGKQYLQTLFPELAKVNLIDKVFNNFQVRDICRLISAFNPEC